MRHNVLKCLQCYRTFVLLWFIFSGLPPHVKKFEFSETNSQFFPRFLWKTVRIPSGIITVRIINRSTVIINHSDSELAVLADSISSCVLFLDLLVMWCSPQTTLVLVLVGVSELYVNRFIFLMKQPTFKG